MCEREKLAWLLVSVFGFGTLAFGIGFFVNNKVRTVEAPKEVIRTVEVPREVVREVPREAPRLSPTREDAERPTAPLEITAITNAGRYLKLSDGTLLEIEATDCNIVVQWTVGDTIKKLTKPDVVSRIKVQGSNGEIATGYVRN